MFFSFGHTCVQKFMVELVYIIEIHSRAYLSVAAVKSYIVIKYKLFYLCSKILKRTLQNVQAVMRKVKKQKSKSEEYCMFYNKFGTYFSINGACRLKGVSKFMCNACCITGKCTKHTQGKCPYIHDPTKIAVCTRWDVFCNQVYKNLEEY